MGARYAKLIEEWREAAGRTREAQRKLKAAFDAHIAGGPPPTEEDVAKLAALRKIEIERLNRAMDYMRRTAGNPPTTPGEL